MKLFRIPVSWEMSAVMYVKAENLEDALLLVDHLPLPDDSSYLDGSFEVYEDEIEEEEVTE